MLIFQDIFCVWFQAQQSIFAHSNNKLMEVQKSEKEKTVIYLNFIILFNLTSLFYLT